jgi:hypothetical protein
MLNHFCDNQRQFYVRKLKREHWSQANFTAKKGKADPKKKPFKINGTNKNQ